MEMCIQWEDVSPDECVNLASPESWPSFLVLALRQSIMGRAFSSSPATHTYNWNATTIVDNVEV